MTRFYFLVILLLSSMVTVAASTKETNNLQNIPLVFESNQGQAPASYSYQVREGGVGIAFAPSAIDIRVVDRTVRLEFLDTHRTSPRGAEPAAARVNYLLGGDSTRWIRQIPTFGAVEYPALYPGIDLRFYGNRSALEHDFVLAPGADPASIRFSVQGADHVRLAGNGDLEIVVGESTLRLRRPVAYQNSGSGRDEVGAGFVLDNATVTFNVGRYDHGRQLVIDPVLAFSTYLTGVLGSQLEAVTNDSTGIYVAGQTMATDYPTTSGALQPACDVDSFSKSCSDVVISKLDPTGHTLIYSTYLGGTRDEFVGGIVVDGNGDAIVSGVSASTDFPSVSFQSDACNLNGYCHFLVSLKPDGSAFNYGGLIGPAVAVNGLINSVAVDASGNAYLTGETGSANFPVTPGTLGGPFESGYPYGDLFILRVAPNGNLVYSTFIPGASGSYFNPWGIQVDASGDAIVAGVATTGLPTTAGVVGPTLDNVLPDATAGFVLKIDPAAANILFATYIPGTTNAYGIVLDHNQDMYVTGNTFQTDLPTSANVLQPSFRPLASCSWCGDGFIAKLTHDGSAIPVATYLSGTGGTLGTNVRSIALDSNSNVVILASTDSVGFPLKNPVLSRPGLGLNSGSYAVDVLTPDLTSVTFGSFFGGSTGATLNGLTVDSAGNPIIVGATFDFDLPTTAGSYEPQAPMPNTTNSIYSKGFITRFDLQTPAASVCSDVTSLAFGTVPAGLTAMKSVNITNCGNADLHVTAAAGTSSTIVVNNGCASVAAGGWCTLTVNFSPADSNPVSDVVSVTANTVVPTLKVSVSGTGGVPQLYLPTEVDFGDRFVNAAGAPSYIYFYNTGTAPLVFTSFQATGDFTVDPSGCTAPVVPDGYCYVGITFVATTTGERDGALSIVDNTTARSHNVSLKGNGIVSYPVPAITAVDSTSVSTTVQYIPVHGTSFFPSSVVSWNGSPRDTSFIADTELLVALTPTDVASVTEATVTVTNPAPGGGTSAPFKVPVIGMLGYLSLRHAVSDPSTGLIYATVDPSNSSYANSVVVIDPGAMAVVKQFSLGNSPNSLALSSDGSLLYVGLDATGQVAQLSLPDGHVNFTLGLANAVGTTGSLANSIAVMPGSPHTWAVNYCGVNYSPCGQGVAVFDDMTRRATKYDSSQLDIDQMLFFDTSTVIGTAVYESPSTTWKFAVDATGISLVKSAQSFETASPGGGQLQTDGTYIYVSNGQVLSPADLSIVKSFANAPYFGGAEALDAANSHIFFVGQNQNNSVPSVAAFGLSSGQQIGEIPLVYGTSFYPLGMARFGSNGLAIMYQGEILFLRSSLVGGSSDPTITSVTPSPIVAGSGDTNISISGTGFAANAVVTWNGTMLTSSFVSSTQLNAIVPASLLAQAGSAIVSVAVAGKASASATVAILQSAYVSVTPASLTFSSTMVGSSSTGKSVTITNLGSSTLSDFALSVTGDFQQTNTCGNELDAGASCTATVVFSPTAGADRSGVLTITGLSGLTLSTVALSGTGMDFQLSGSGDGGSVPAQTVKSGTPASFNLSLEGLGGFTGTINFTCSNAPTNGSCTVNPTSIAAGSSTSTIVVTVNTSTTTTAMLRRGGVWLAFACVFPAMFLATQKRRSMRRKMQLFLIALGLVVFSMTSCGGGGGGGGSTTPPPSSTTKLTPAGTYTVQVAASSGTTSKSINLQVVVQ